MERGRKEKPRQKKVNMIILWWAKKNSLVKSGYLSINAVSYLESYFGLIQLLFQNNRLVKENVQGYKATSSPGRFSLKRPGDVVGYKAHEVRYISRVTVCIQ